MPTYKEVRHVPDQDWAREVIDWAIAEDRLIVTDARIDDWNEPMTTGRYLTMEWRKEQQGSDSDMGSGSGSGSGDGSGDMDTDPAPPPPTGDLFIPAFRGSPQVGLLSPKNQLTSGPGGALGSGTYESMVFNSGIRIIPGSTLKFYDCWIYGGGNWQILNGPNGDILLEDCEIGNPQVIEYGINGYGAYDDASTVTMRRVNIHHVEDGFRYTGTNNYFEMVWVHDLQSSDPGAHYDASQDTGTSHNATVAYCHLDCSRADGVVADLSGAILCKSDLGPINGPIYRDNFLDGGAYTLYVYRENYACDGVQVYDNIFGNKAAYGKVAISGNPGIDRWDGNVDLNGNPVNY